MVALSEHHIMKYSILRVTTTQWGTWLVQSEHMTLDLQAVSSSSILSVEITKK